HPTAIDAIHENWRAAMILQGQHPPSILVNHRHISTKVVDVSAATGERRYWPALRASSMAYWFTKRPAPGSPRPHDPSDSPGRLTHRKASTFPLPVSVVGAAPRARPPGLHQYMSPSAGPAPLRDVSTT